MGGTGFSLCLEFLHLNERFLRTLVIDSVGQTIGFYGLPAELMLYYRGRAPSLEEDGYGRAHERKADDENRSSASRRFTSIRECDPSATPDRTPRGDKSRSVSQ